MIVQSFPASSAIDALVTCVFLSLGAQYGTGRTFSTPSRYRPTQQPQLLHRRVHVALSAYDLVTAVFCLSLEDLQQRASACRLAVSGFSVKRGTVDMQSG